MDRQKLDHSEDRTFFGPQFYGPMWTDQDHDKGFKIIFLRLLLICPKKVINFIDPYFIFKCSKREDYK